MHDSGVVVFRCRGGRGGLLFIVYCDVLVFIYFCMHDVQMCILQLYDELV
jgi:hypothetical protein